MLTADPELLDLERIEREFAIPCDYSASGAWPGPHDAPAEWVLKMKCPECALRAQRLLCDSCKTKVLTTEHGCYCGGCEVRIVPFRHVVVRVEPL